MKKIIYAGCIGGFVLLLLHGQCQLSDEELSDVEGQAYLI
jgi:hypothetical protein